MNYDAISIKFTKLTKYPYFLFFYYHTHAHARNLKKKTVTVINKILNLICNGKYNI